MDNELNNRKVSSYQSRSCNLKRHIFTRRQDSVFVEQHNGNPYAEQGKHKQAERQNTIFCFYAFVFSVGCQQVNQFDIGYRPHIEKHNDKEDDCKAKYVCSNYKSNTGTCSAHFIREETLKLFVLQRIFDVTALFFDDAMTFEEAARNQRFQEAEKDAKKRKREIAQAEKRIAELDRIFKRIYEDDISGAISHERFLKTLRRL